MVFSGCCKPNLNIVVPILLLLIIDYSSDPTKPLICIYCWNFNLRLTAVCRCVC